MAPLKVTRGTHEELLYRGVPLKQSETSAKKGANSSELKRIIVYESRSDSRMDEEGMQRRHGKLQ